MTIGSDGSELTRLEVSLYAGDMLTMGNGYGATYEDGVITIGADVVGYLRGASEDELQETEFTATFGEGDGSYSTVFKFTK